MTRSAKKPGRSVFARMLACERGSNAVEFALVSPLLLFMLLGVCYVGLYIGISHAVQSVSFESARYAMVGADRNERSGLLDRWFEHGAERYVLLDPTKLTWTVLEEEGRMTVEAVYDVSYLRMPTLLTDVVALGSTIRRSTPVSLP